MGCHLLTLTACTPCGNEYERQMSMDIVNLDTYELRGTVTCFLSPIENEVVMTYLVNLCPVHLLRQNYFCPGPNENFPGQNHFCPGQKILSKAKKSFFIQFITNDELFIHVQNFLFRTKSIFS